jgi:membrane protein YdbS with pleckstrin-like domain
VSEPEPQRRLSPRARWAWGLEQLGVWAVALFAGHLVAGHAHGRFAALLWIVPAAGLLAGTFAVPELRWRRWRWDLHADAIDIRHGTLTVRRTLVPLVRVQHVETRRDIVEQLFDLATVVVHTAAGSHTIPLLAEADADELRDRIASLTSAGDG